MIWAFGFSPAKILAHCNCKRSVDASSAYRSKTFSRSASTSDSGSNLGVSLTCSENCFVSSRNSSIVLTAIASLLSWRLYSFLTKLWAARATRSLSPAAKRAAAVAISLFTVSLASILNRMSRAKPSRYATGISTVAPINRAMAVPAGPAIIDGRLSSLMKLERSGVGLGTISVLIVCSSQSI
jgi:hypothetical protein